MVAYSLLASPVCSARYEGLIKLRQHVPWVQVLVSELPQKHGLQDLLGLR